MLARLPEEEGKQLQLGPHPSEIHLHSTVSDICLHRRWLSLLYLTVSRVELHHPDSAVVQLCVRMPA
jgi:hypothetical protein